MSGSSSPNFASEITAWYAPYLSSADTLSAEPVAGAAAVAAVNSRASTSFFMAGNIRHREPRGKPPDDLLCIQKFLLPGVSIPFRSPESSSLLGAADNPSRSETQQPL